MAAKPKPAGPGVAARKYDLLTAIGAHGLAQSPADQRRALRLITLITARYNWAADLLSVGQREIARLWHVDERTVKREMSRLRDCGWLVLHRQGARGRVAEYRIDLDAILRDTQPSWAAVGPDLQDRLAPQPVPAGTETNVVPFRPATEPQISGTDPWARICRGIAAEAPDLFPAWIARLRPGPLEEGRLTLIAPSRFHARYVETHMADLILRHARRIDPTIFAVTLGCA